MEQHPVPQNVTTFQFRLIGDMTIKQFGYLAGGVISAYICYKLPLPVIFTVPLAIVAGMTGFGLAFVPVEERPMDVWVASFLKSIYSPTLYVWQREKPMLESLAAVTGHQQQTRPVTPVIHHQTAPAATPAVASVTAHPPQPPPPLHHVPAKRKQSIFDLVSGFLFGKATAPSVARPSPAPPTLPKGQAPPSPGMSQYAFAQNKHDPVQPAAFPDQFSHLPIPSVAGKGFEPLNQAPNTVTPIPREDPVPPQNAENERKIKDFETKLQTLQKELETKNVSESRIVELQNQLTQVLSERNSMQEELLSLKTKIKNTPPSSAAAQPPLTPGARTAPTAPTVKVITPDSAVHAGLPRLTTIPNVVTGIIKDHDANFLPGVLVTVRDKEGVPLRALKTNKLGQFAASTPLANNTYIIEVEDPRNRYVFDRVQITLNGAVVPAIEIVARSEKEISREKISKDLFGGGKI